MKETRELFSLYETTLKRDRMKSSALSASLSFSPNKDTVMCHQQLDISQHLHMIPHMFRCGSRVCQMNAHIEGSDLPHSPS